MKIKIKGLGTTGLADALTAALPHLAVGGVQIWINEANEVPQETFAALAKRLVAQKTERPRRWYAQSKDSGVVIAQSKDSGGSMEMVQYESEDGRLVTIRGTFTPSPKAYGLGTFPTAQDSRITKLSNIIKRAEPRLFMEVLQEFGNLEKLTDQRRDELEKRLERIRKEYGL